jgi:hypothetical protein
MNSHQDISSENYATKRDTFHKDISQQQETKKSRTQISRQNLAAKTMSSHQEISQGPQNTIMTSSSGNLITAKKHDAPLLSRIHHTPSSELTLMHAFTSPPRHQPEPPTKPSNH